MTKKEEFRKQTEEAKFEAFSLMCKKVADLEAENERLRTRCEQARDEGTGYMQQLEKENAELARKLKIKTELSKRLGVAYREYEQLTNEQDEHLANLEKENEILSKALNLYINWADECGIGWDNFPDMTEKWYKTVEEKELGWIEGLTFMVMEEAKEQLRK